MIFILKTFFYISQDPIHSIIIYKKIIDLPDFVSLSLYPIPPELSAMADGVK